MEEMMSLDGQEMAAQARTPRENFWGQMLNATNQLCGLAGSIRNGLEQGEAQDALTPEAYQAIYPKLQLIYEKTLAIVGEVKGYYEAAQTEADSGIITKPIPLRGRKH